MENNELKYYKIHSDLDIGLENKPKISSDNIDDIIDDIKKTKQEKRGRKLQHKKKCKICNEEKNREDFVIDHFTERQIYIKSKCKECYNKEKRDHYQQVKEIKKQKYEEKKPKYKYILKFTTLEELNIKVQEIIREINTI